MELDSYSFVLLKRGPRALQFSEEELDVLQEQRLAISTPCKTAASSSLAISRRCCPYGVEPLDPLRDVAASAAVRLVTPSFR